MLIAGCTLSCYDHFKYNWKGVLLMKLLISEEEFRAYLGKVLSSERLVRDCISRCRRVEQSEGNLHDEYIKDCGRSLLNRLSYSKEDAERGLDPEHRVTFKGSKGSQSIREGTASLRNAVQHYFEFLNQQRKCGVGAKPTDSVLVK